MNSDNRKQKIQDLVDDHARLCLSNSEIKLHLLKDHGILISELIPPPTKAAQKARKRAIETGVISSSGFKTMKTIADSSSRTLSDEQNKPKNEDEIAATLSRATVTSFGDDDDKSWKNSESEFFARIYCSHGPTLLDRLIRGLSGIYRECNYGPGSDYEVFLESISSKIKSKKLHPSDFFVEYADDWNVSRAIDAAVYPWFQAGRETINIQIESEMAEIFLAGKAPTSSSWMKSFTEKPVYIDIHEKSSGQRTVSGIFCKPTPTGDSFRYMAAIEWINQGYEAFIFGEYGKPESAILMYPTNTDDELLPQEVLDALYDPIARQVEKIIAMSYMYYRTKIDARQLLVPLSNMSRGGVPTGSKKERNKEKTHSYFRVLKLEVPKDRFGFTGKIGRSWSLDHLVGVSGHFRWQPYGTGRTLHKLIWIDAYEKGQGPRHRPENNPVLIQVPTP